MKEQLRTARRATLQRKGLYGITNSPMPLKILNEDSNPCDNITSDYVEQLIKEKMLLLKLIEERNKTIELTEGELQQLRICYQKTQLQNRNLAQTNSQMLAELNLGKDKIKALHHEIACKNALLKAKNLELQEKAVQNTEKNGSMEVKHEAVPKGNDDKRKNICSNTTQQRSQSLCVYDINKNDSMDKDEVKHKRQCVRRQSARFISQQRESAEDAVEIEAAKIQLQQNLKWVSDSTAPDLSNNKDTAKTLNSTSTPRVSMGRPLRRVTEKVQSYKEPPINIKMRRES